MSAAEVLCRLVTKPRNRFEPTILGVREENLPSPVEFKRTKVPKEALRGLLSLPLELQHEILDICEQGDRAALARTSKAIAPASRKVLYRNPQLPQWEYGLSFRKQCDRDETLKKQIRTLAFPFSEEWMAWFRWNFSVEQLPLVKSINIGTTESDVSDYGLWDAFKIASDLAPNVRMLTLCQLPPSIEFTPAPIAALRQLFLADCLVDGALLRELAQNLPALEALLIHMPLDVSLQWDCIAALTTFPNLNELALQGLSVLDELTSPAPGEVSGYEFKSLVWLTVHPSWGITDWEMMKHLSLPKLKWLDLTISQSTPNLADAVEFFNCKPRMPLLSCIYFDCDAEEVEDTPGVYNPVPVKMDELFSPLQTLGFQFKLSKDSGFGSSEEPKYWCWKAFRDDREV